MKKLILSLLIIFLSGCQSPKIGVSDITSDKVLDKYNKSELKAKYALEGTNLKRIVKDNPKDKIEIEIGNVSTLLGGADEFTPDIKISRWDEVNFTLHPKMIDEVAALDKTLTFDKEQIIFSTPQADYKLYEMPISEANPEGAFEYEIILKEKPKTNVIEFSLEMEGLDFFYQPELTQQEKDEGAFRPKNVIGSYAVYTSEQKTNWTGGKEYKTGKVGHIFRPKIIDSVGTEVWGELNIANGILSVTIPHDFLDKATYPVKHATGLTFGYTTLGASQQNGNSDEDLKGMSDTGAVGTLTSVTAGLAKQTGSGSISNIYYFSNATNDNNSIFSGTQSDSMTTTKTWFTKTAGSEAISGATVYVAVTTFYQSTAIAIDTGTGTNGGFYGGLGNNTWATANTMKYSVYATYTASEGAPATSNPSAILNGNTILNGNVIFK